MAEKRLYDAMDNDNNQAVNQDDAESNNPEKRLRAQANEEGPKPGLDGMLLKPDDPDFNDGKAWCKIWDSLKCPACLDVCTPPIHQCLKGHNICHGCKAMVNACPLCASKYHETRNFALESMMESMPLPCKYRVEGCPFKGDQRKKKEHEQACEWQPYKCPVEKCEASVSEDAIIDHLVTQHKWTFFDVTDKVKDGAYEELLTVAIPPPANDCIVQMLKVEQWGVFLLIASAWRTTVMWTMQTIASRAEAKNYEFEVELCTLEERRRKASYTGSVSSMLSTVTSVIEEGSCLTTNAMFLRATCPPEENGRCKMSLKIRKVA